MKNAERSIQTKKAILRAAYEVIHEKGFQNATLGEIMIKAEMSRGALYHHFPNKMNLGYSMVEKHLAKLVKERWVTPLETTSDPVRSLQDMVTGVFRNFTEKEVKLGCPVANLAAEMSPVDEGFKIRINSIYFLMTSEISRALEDSKKNGVIRKNVDSDKIALFYVASIAGARSLAKNGGREVLEASSEMMVSFLEDLRE